MSKVLVAIVTCHRFHNRIDMVRKTWLKDLKLDYKIFYGGHGGRQPAKDEVFLEVEDTYESLSFKTRAIMKWAVAHGYDTVFKCDDDTYVFPERLVNVLPSTGYEGRVNTTNKALVPNGWCSGFAYWLSGEALITIANAPDPTHKAEDMWVGITLNAKGIKPKKQPAFMVLSVIQPALWINYKDMIIAACEFKDSAMLQFHDAIRNGNVPTSYTSPMNPRTGKRVMKFGAVLRRKRPEWS